MSSLTTSVHDVAQQLLQMLEQWRSTPLAGLTSQYRTYLAAKGNTSKYVRSTVNRIQRVIEAMNISTIGELTVPTAQVAIHAFIGPAPMWSLETANRAIGDLQAFCEWLVAQGLAPFNTLKKLKRYKAATDPRHQRRPFGEPELSALIAAAEKGPRFWGIDGIDRAWFYRLAAHTGLRASELASLRVCDFLLDVQPAVAIVAVSADKSRRKNDPILLRQDIVAPLRAWLAGRDPQSKLWRMCKSFPYHLLIQFDLAAAGIEYRDAHGRFADVHAIRHTFGTSLGRVAGIKTVQKLMRHADMRMTARYMHSGREDELKALAALPALVSQN